jgi:PAS domain S-box-containing protein
MKATQPNKSLSPEQQFSGLLKQAPLSLLVLKGNNLVIEFVNDMYLAIVDKKEEALLGRPILEAMPELAKQGYEDVLHHVLKTGETFFGQQMPATFTRFGRQITAWFNFVYQPWYDADGNIAGVMMAGYEVLESKEANEELEKRVSERTFELQQKNEELRRSEERYHHMIAEVEDYAILLLSVDGYIQNWNKGAEKIKGYKAEEIIGQSFRRFYTKEDQENGLPQRLINEAKSKGKAAHEGWRVRKDGSKFWGSVVITALHNIENDIIGFSKVTRDLTERKLAEDRLNAYAAQLEQKSQALERSNAELSSFSYVASHDMQEPLRKIQAFGNLILNNETDKLSQQARDYFGRMVKAAGRMQNLIDSLLEFSRTSSAAINFEKSDLNLLLDEVKKDLRERIEETHTTIKSDPLPLLAVIPFQVKQLLFNLISNAIKYAKPNEHPVIHIKGEMVAGNSIDHPQAIAGTHYYTLSVIDNGIGFEKEYAVKIFELFQRLHGRNEYSGSGVGLAICKKIAENHGGFITAESEPGQGSAFHFYISVAVN